MYIPYSYMFLGCLVELVLVYAAILSAGEVIRTGTPESESVESRLLQEAQVIIYPYHYSVVGVLIASLTINYIENLVYVFLFCKYLKQYIPDRQIDRVSNYVVLVFGTLTNFRFSLLAYSKMFPKPSIMVQNASKLTPLHYLCIASLFATALPLTAAGILIYNA